MLGDWLTFFAFASSFFIGTEVNHPPKREFRAVWVTTFHNIDWPSVKGLEPDVQKREFIALAERQQRNGMNALIVQARPCGDAFYPSRLASWSEYLTGEQGKPPEPFYDPMAFAVEELHKRNMEFHAWFNPFRAVSHMRFSSVEQNHVSRLKPEWCFQYGEKLFFNPGIPEVREYLVNVVLEVARNYDIDGIHFDDYFYPYREKGIRIDDYATYRKYGSGFSDIDTWRRHNIDTFIKTVSDSLQVIKPHIKFGISPAAIWRNKSKDPRGSDTQSFTSYDMLFADVRKWLQEGWIDYVAPQLYYSDTNPYASYSRLLPWWSQNTFGRHLYIGQAVFKVKKDISRHWKNPTQLPRHLSMNQSYEAIQGNVFFSENSFRDNPHAVEEMLQNNWHKYEALIPPMTWKDSIPPQAPRNLTAYKAPGKVFLSWEPPILAPDGERASYYVLYRFQGNQAVHLNDPAYIVSLLKEPEYVDYSVQPGEKYTYVLTSMDRLHNESRTCAAVIVKNEILENN